MESKTPAYGSFIKGIKDLVYRHQYEAMKQVNVELIQLYWKIGEEIDRQQREKGWGKSVIEVLAQELQKEFPGVQGVSARNLWLMRTFYLEYSQNSILQPMVAELERTPQSTISPPMVAKLEEKPQNVILPPMGAELQGSNLAPVAREIGKPILPPLVAEISWTKNIVIIQKCKNPLEREFYIRMTKRYGWTKDVLINVKINAEYTT